MPSQLHEALIELFRHRPSLAAELLADPFGMELPKWAQARLDSSELTDRAPPNIGRTPLRPSTASRDRCWR
jgi:hypothetical protein